MTKKCESSGCIVADLYEGAHLTVPVVRVRSTETGTVMQATLSEWRTFIAEVKSGQWDTLEGS